jgi:tetratricopeptide (TPR) repeat protein
MAAGANRLDQAIAFYRRALSVREQLASLDPTNAQAGRDLALSHDRIGDVLNRLRLLSESSVAYEAALNVYRRIAAGDPGNGVWQEDVRLSERKLARTRAASGAADAATGDSAGRALIDTGDTVAGGRDGMD